VSIGYYFGLCIVVSLISIRVGMTIAARFGILDHPGGHKQHAVSTPFVGGFGVLMALIAAIYLTHSNFPENSPHPLRAMALGGVILFLTGLADDIWRISFRTRLAIEASVALIMIFLGGVELRSLGKLVLTTEVELDWLAVPITVFATVGLINALNMIDGIDGISGSLSLISLGFVAVLAAMAGNDVYLLLTIAVMGAVSGFLYFNLRYPSNRRAKVFLGDNGSMLLGFYFAWLFIALSQGEQKSMTPVTALWLFCVPLMDTISVMIRRTWMGNSPFQADRNHLHHLFLRAGFRVSDTVWIISLAQIALGAIGVAGLLLGVPEQLMFGLYLAVFAVYFYWIALPGRFVAALRRLNLALGLPCAFAHGVFIGYFQKAASREMLGLLSNELDTLDDYRLSLHRLSNSNTETDNVFGVVETRHGDDEASVGRTRRLMTRIKRRLDGRSGVQVHLLMHRSQENDRRQARYGSQTKTPCQRQADRRQPEKKPTIYSGISHKGKIRKIAIPGVESIHSSF
jgi:UDP-GlcNAc:undecaprenyl-phosphate GlcNAc-1-phosphate transferase